MNSPTPFDPAGHRDDQVAALATSTRAAATIEQAIGVLAWRHDLTINQAGVLLDRLAGAQCQSAARTARVLVRDAGTPPTLG